MLHWFASTPQPACTAQRAYNAQRHSTSSLRHHIHASESNRLVTRNLRRIVAIGSVGLLTSIVASDEPRAPAPEFSADSTRGIFFERIEDAFRGERPTLASLRKRAEVKKPTPANSESTETSGSSGAWTKLISPTSLEDEVKRVKLHFDSVITTPGAFNSGGYQDARLDLSILATMFAVIHQHDGDVRWKDQAAAARNLLARTAFNCKAGSSQVYAEAKLRKADLQDLISGSGLANRGAQEETDWSAIVDRSPMMEYAEATLDSLKSVTNNTATAKGNIDQVRREAEVIAVIGHVLTQEGMDEFDDEDYAGLSQQMSRNAREVVAALEREDFDSVRKSVGAVTQSCDACHEQYR